MKVCNIDDKQDWAENCPLRDSTEYFPEGRFGSVHSYSLKPTGKEVFYPVEKGTSYSKFFEFGNQNTVVDFIECF